MEGHPSFWDYIISERNIFFKQYSSLNPNDVIYLKNELSFN